MDNYTLAKEVLSGKWGNGQERRERLTAAGYDYMAVQSIVNSLVRDRDNASEVVLDPPVSIGPEKPLSIDYNPKENDGIIVNILV